MCFIIRVVIETEAVTDKQCIYRAIRLITEQLLINNILPEKCDSVNISLYTQLLVYTCKLLILLHTTIHQSDERYAKGIDRFFRKWLFSIKYQDVIQKNSMLFLEIQFSSAWRYAPIRLCKRLQAVPASRVQGMVQKRAYAAIQADTDAFVPPTRPFLVVVRSDWGTHPRPHFALNRNL